MKWALVVYFFICCVDSGGGWKTAEELKHHGWYRIIYNSGEECIRAQWAFTENHRQHKDKIRASCELVGDYD